MIEWDIKVEDVIGEEDEAEVTGEVIEVVIIIEEDRITFMTTTPRPLSVKDLSGIK